MTCPRCGHSDTDIVEHSDSTAGARAYRRRCPQCGLDFESEERLRNCAVMVVKRDGRRERFDREKLQAGLALSASKRPLPSDSIAAIVDDIERRLRACGRSEVSSRVVGEMAITHLKALDPIAYIRFASAYRQFVSLEDMLNDLASLSQSPLPPAQQPRLFEDDFDALLNATAAGAAPREPTPIHGARSSR